MDAARTVSGFGDGGCVFFLSIFIFCLSQNVTFGHGLICMMQIWIAVGLSSG
jgi:hypothetical protein